MIKNRLLILENMVHVGAMWRLGFLISLLLLFFPVNGIASENSPSANITDPEQLVQQNKEEPSSSLIHVSEGTVVYGMEIFSENPKPKHVEDKQGTPHIAKKAKKHTAERKNLTKVLPKQAPRLPESDSRISTHRSADNFKISKQEFSSGMLNNILLKIAILSRVSGFQTIFSNNTNSSYIPYLLLKGGWADSVFFTRPPPFI